LLRPIRGVAYTSKEVFVLGLGVPLGMIVQDVNDAGMSVVNSTESWPLHILDPGYVDRSVQVLGNSIYVYTYGEGTGLFGAFNAYLGPKQFELLDTQMRYEMFGGRNTRPWY
jgi:hypothetical protein